ncbi:replication protein RepA [Falsiroseomonas sp.]|uniref:replication protein RepA n=1 Tax=Falsiroseomonas sp. TaxID=2870721 RepID=UPI0035631E92
MSLNRPPRPLAQDAGPTQPSDAVIWLHAAFCGLGLPMRATRGAWQRDIGTASVRIEPGASDEVVPSGRVLRLSLLHICDAAFRANSPVVELADDPSRLAAALGIEANTRDLTDQWERMHAARILLSWDGGPAFSVFDARSRARAGKPAWRSGVRLNSRFLASLLNHAIPLDRRVVRELSASPAALDAYAWIRLSLRGAAPDRIITTTWEELLSRFGTASQDAGAFRVAFEAALRLVFDVDRSIDLAVDDDGVSVRLAPPADDESVADGTPPAQPGTDAVADGTAAPAEPLAVPPAASPAVEAAAAEPAESIRENPEVDCPPRSEPHPPAQAEAATVAPVPEDRITQNSISLPRHLTGLALVVWLRRGHGEESVLVGITPNPRFEAERLTLLAVEPMVIQVSGGLNERDFERVSAWVMTNRDVIDDFWEGRITSFAEINRRVRKAPAPGWR